MVHALQEIHHLLKPDGALIDIRPNGLWNKFIRPQQQGEAEHFIGYMHETDDYLQYRQAEKAVQDVIAIGLFQLEKAQEFEYRVYADSFTELKTHVDETRSKSLVAEEVVAEAKRLDDKYGIGKTFISEEIFIGLLRPL